MCCAQLGPKLALMPGAEMFSVGTHSTLLLSVPRYMYRFHSLFALLARSLPLYFCPWLYVAVSGFWWWWWEGGGGGWIVGCFVRVLCGCGCCVLSLLFRISINVVFFSSWLALVSVLACCGWVSLPWPCWMMIAGILCLVWTSLALTSGSAVFACWVVPSCVSVIIFHFWFVRGFGLHDASCLNFCAGSLFLHITPSLYDWGCSRSVAILRLSI